MKDDYDDALVTSFNQEVLRRSNDLPEDLQNIKEEEVRDDLIFKLEAIFD